MKHKHLESRNRQQSDCCFFLDIFSDNPRRTKPWAGISCGACSWSFSAALRWASSGETTSVSALGSSAVRWMMCGGGTGITFVHRRVLTGARKPRAMFAANTRALKQTHPSCVLRHTSGGWGDVDPGLLPSGWGFHHMWMYCGDGALNMDLCSVFSSSLFMVTPPFCELGLGQQMWVFTYCSMDHQLQPQVDGGSNVNLK